MASARGCPSQSAHSGTQDGTLHHSSFTRALALDIAFRIGLFDRVLARNTCNRCYQRHPAVLGFDLVEAQQQPGMKSAIH